VSAIGAFTFVLHSHLPYARLAGRWPHGEEWIHEAAVETYIPLLQTLYDLKNEGVPYRLTLGITPILAEQLADADVLEHLGQYLDDRIEASKKDMAYYQAEGTADVHLHFLAEWYLHLFERIKHDFDVRFNRDLIGSFRQLQDEGLIEITTCAATHGYLPLLGRDSSIVGQLKAGVASYRRMFGRDPRGIWLPECAYRPAYMTEDGKLRPGIEYWLNEQGLKVFFSETHTITGGQPVGVAAGDVVGPYGAIKRRYVIPAATTVPERSATTYEAYYVSDTTHGPSAEQHSGVSVIGRNNRTGQQVWSAEWGYPGDFDYREFHRKAGTSGLQYWRVTGAKTDLAYKDYYHPDWAAYKVDQHAEHFAHLVGDLIRSHYNQTGQYGLISSNYDTELFGHWWFEGVAWIGKVLRHLAANEDVEMTTASSYVEVHPPREVLHLPESSWGAGGTHFVWDNSETHWMWEPIHEAEQRMEALANRYSSSATPDEEAVLKQAARELLLLESSDWPFLVTTGQAREYAIQRFSQHIERFNLLVGSLEKGQPNTERAAHFWELDKVFPDIDYRWFATPETK
jgi:1,4-alpha-glucan branching enzyme